MTPHLYLATLLLAFCSIVYELLLGQTLSAFLGNTIVRYSVTIGLYMSSMGIGALLLPKSLHNRPVTGLLKVELALSVLGSSSVLLLIAAHSLGAEGLLFSLLAHSLIIAIGVLTGFEIPVLIAIANQLKPNSEARVLGVDYIGAFLGAVLFAFLFYPKLGIFTTALFIGTINAVVGVSMFTFRSAVADNERTRFSLLIYLQVAVAVVLLFLLFHAEVIEQIGTEMYLG